MICDTHRLGGRSQTVQPPRLVHPRGQAYNPSTTTYRRDFKYASEAEKRKIVRENVAQLFGFDFD